MKVAVTTHVNRRITDNIISSRPKTRALNKCSENWTLWLFKYLQTMISHRQGRYIFIRLFVLYFRCIAPLSLVYCFHRVITLFGAFRFPLLLEIYIAAEATFYLFVFLP